MIFSKYSGIFYKIISGLLVNRSYKKDKILTMPTFIGMVVEERCCLKCRFCNIWKTKKLINGIGLKKQKIILDKLKNWLGGNVSISFAGGEPLMNPNFFALVNYARKLGFHTSTNSNSFLINKKIAKKIVDSGLSSISISLDFPDAKRHNYFRGESLVYEKVLKGIKFLNKYAKSKLRVTINTVIMRQNLNDLEGMVQLVDKLGIDGISFQPIYETFASIKHNPKWYLSSEFWPKDKEKVVKVIDKLIEMKRNGFKIRNSEKSLEKYKEYFNDYNSFIENNLCYVGINNFIIDSFGDVSLCWFFKSSIGNVLKLDPQKIWNNLEARKIRRKCRKCKCGCRVLLCNMPVDVKEFIFNLLKDLKRKLGSI